MPPPAWTAPPATNWNGSAIGAEALSEVGAVEIAPRRHLVAVTPHQPQRLQAVDRELVAQRPPVHDLPQRRDQVLFPLQAQQVVAQVIAERSGVVLRVGKEVV